MPDTERAFPTRKAVRGELLTLFYRFLPIVLAANVVNSLLIAAIFYERVPAEQLFGWAIVMLLMVAVRATLLLRYRPPGTDRSRIRHWSRVAIIGSAASGIIWGAAGWLFFQPDYPVSYAVLAFVLGGMGSGALVGLSPCLPAFVAYLVPSVIPLTVRLAALGATEHLAMAGMGAMYTIGMIFLGRRYHRTLVQSMKLRFQNAELLQTLESRVQARTEELEQANATLHALALQDSLTGLPNRTLFQEQLQRSRAQVRRTGGYFALAVVDLDHFKDVNDIFGHPAGDRILQETADRLKACVRASDHPARLGGDEFSVIITDLEDPATAAIIARKVIDSLNQPYWIDSSEIHLGSSIGITVYPSDGEDLDLLLSNADIALYRAKHEGRNTFVFYSSELTETIERRKLIERGLRTALEREELNLYFQPQVNIADGRITGAEALLRWRHPILGPLRPEEIIDVAEASGLMLALDLWVLRRACEEARKWRDVGLPSLVTAVNVSRSHFRRGELDKVVTAVTREKSLDFNWLEIEVTEGLFLHPKERIDIDSLRRLREQGVKVAIDDFGTGYSSLSRLQSLPVDAVKIDRSFVAGIHRTAGAEHFLRAIIGLARCLNLRVVAEGVEELDQLEFLRSEKCDSAQGYLFSKPLSASDFTRLLERGMVCQRQQF